MCNKSRDRKKDNKAKPALKRRQDARSRIEDLKFMMSNGLA